ncbi:MAG: hypothetical protein A3I26_03280 [Candidatus Yanofskybacteria bacterium RIFCSPLOWO2_02_FULL_43_10]|nr:MAG: hypothetical protein A3C69_03045 [Candidatus Yanofskybacteria bacterium RIFCSPHIGHO2_02_FULL_43_12]OGN17839.1 MAG: hypothetical protein A3E34_01245 [Candidatus Yanofskybacteria bacterium RIFCSPHIGHO2_12_FULL_43_11]OGN24797.1 MAG: hypothetical protein A2923_03200 [Candidatus Yanofskybacteria bacterium RIFCSPLOWO2_01_FULL_43_46]OGN28970.1 MAG: hypothetical protein A3I26_03280 [Candidatus Yanofskybacteria bacterium RIFCSPLOWO2_02_FULL_43_10]
MNIFNRYLLSVIVSFLPIFTVFNPAMAADFNILSDNNKLNPGKIFVVDIKIDTAGTLINASQAKIKFSPEIMQVKSISTNDSVFNFWLQEPNFSNTDGTIVFIGGTSKEISGDALKVLSITFISSGVGENDISFTDGAITASDGTGNNILVNANGVHFTIVPAGQTIAAPTVKTQTAQSANPSVASTKQSASANTAGSLSANISGGSNPSNSIMGQRTVLGNIVLILTLFNTVAVSCFLGRFVSLSGKAKINFGR